MSNLILNGLLAIGNELIKFRYLDDELIRADHLDLMSCAEFLP